MAAATHLHHRLLLPLLLFFFPSAVLFRLGTPPPLPPSAALYPVVLLPGNTCSQLEARLTSAYRPPPDSPQCGAGINDRGRWFRLWRNATAMADPSLAPCLSDQLRLVYDPAARDFRNVPGVHTRVLGFGSTSGFLADSDANKDLCMGRLVDALQQQAGYVDGETLFGAPYDFRQAPAAPGQPCRFFARFTRRLKALVEHASAKNGGKPVVVVSHSQGGYMALEFLNRSPLPWRNRYIKHYVMASTGAGGFLLPLRNLAATPEQALEAPDAFLALPSPLVFSGSGSPAPLVVTRGRNYTAAEIPEFLEAIGVPPLGVWLYVNRALPVSLGFRAPLVPTTCVNGVLGVETTTMRQLVYWDGNFSETPTVVYGDGDGLLPVESILALDTVIGGDPKQVYYKSVRLNDTSHAGVVSDPAALKRVVDEILSSTHGRVSNKVCHCERDRALSLVTFGSRSSCFRREMNVTLRMNEVCLPVTCVI